MDRARDVLERLFALVGEARIDHDWTVTPQAVTPLRVGLERSGPRRWAALNTTYDPLKELVSNGHTYASRFPRIEMGIPAAALGGMNSLGPGSFNEKYFERRPPVFFFFFFFFFFF